MRTLPNPASSYTARRTGAIVVSQAESGALMAWIPYALCNSQVEYQGKHSVCIGTKDGELQIRTIETLKKIWPDWDKSNPFALEEIPLPEADENGAFPAEFELADCFHDNSFTPEGASAPVTQFKANWINPLGGSQNMPTPLDDQEKKKVAAKWGAKFKAAAGGAAAKPAQKPAAAKAQQRELAPAAAKTTSAAPARAAVGGPPSRKAAAPAKARTATQEEVWTAFYNKENGSEETQDALAERFYAAQDEIAPNANGELTPEQWGQVADKIGV